MPKPSVDSARQLGLLRWPLLAIAIASGCAVAHASWNRVGHSQPATRAVATIANPPASEAAVSPSETPVEIVATTPQGSASTPPAGESHIADEPTTDDAANEEPANEKPAIEQPMSSEAATSEPAAALAAPMPVAATGLTLVNPVDSKLKVGFAIDGDVSYLAPGETRDLTGDGPWEIAFHRGGDFGDEKQTLAAGRYDFSVSQAGWSLSPGKSPAAAIDDPSEQR